MYKCDRPPVPSCACIICTDNFQYCKTSFGELYSLPFNMYTFNKMWGVVTPAQAEAKIEEQRKTAGITQPQKA